MKKKIGIIVSLTILTITGLITSASAEELKISSFRNQVVGANSNVVATNMSIQKQMGWQKINNEWYYFDDMGNFKVGWINKNGEWYYFNSFGIMVHDTLVDGCYLNSNGAWIK